MFEALVAVEIMIVATILGRTGGGRAHYSGLSSCRFFHASIPGLWWKRGNTHRNRFSPGFRHQQSG